MEHQQFNELYGRYLDTRGIAKKRLDIAYGPYGRNRLDIYYPDDGAGPWPVVIFFHGGAFFKGDKGRYQLKPALFGLVRGYAVISVNYRLAPTDLLPAAFLDARMAVQYVKANATELNIDPDRIALWGESAGASLACYAGLIEKPDLPDDPQAEHTEQNCEVRAVVDWYSPIDLVAIELEQRENGRIFDGKTAQEFCFGLEGDELLEVLRKVDPENYLTDAIPPVLIEHGSGDTVVPIEMSLKFRQKLLEHLPEDQVPMRIVEGAEHGVDAFENEENLKYVFDFLDRYLRG